MDQEGQLVQLDLQELDQIANYLADRLQQKQTVERELREQLDQLEQQSESEDKLLAIIKNAGDPNRSFFSPYAHMQEEQESKLMKEKQQQEEAVRVAISDKIKAETEEVEKLKLFLEHLEGVKGKYEGFNDEISKRDSIIEEKFHTASINLGRKILETQENERQRIAMELHDTLVQNLTSLVHKTELCTRLLDIDIVRTRLELLTMTETLRNSINDLRETIYDLKPMSLNDLGLVVTVERMLSVIKKNNKVQTLLQVISKERQASKVLNLTLYRIIQEACNNVIKHAGADSIVVRIDYSNEKKVFIEIIDDGKGFCFNNIKTGKNGYGLGLSIMKERTYLLSGDLVIDSKEGNGTKISLEVPFLKDKEEE